MDNEFKLNKMIQQYLDEYCNDNGEMKSEDIQGLIREIARMVQYDVSFESNLLNNTTNYIECNYPRINFWQENIGDFPSLESVSEDEFDYQLGELKKNFSHKRVDWLNKAGKKLYGKSMGESQSQQTNPKKRPRSVAKKTSKIMLVVIALIIILLVTIFGMNILTE